MVVLYADDDPDDMELFGEALRAIDRSIVFIKARSAADALILLQGNLVPDFIFLDINMPLMDGIECLFRIRAFPLLGNVPVIMLTTSQNEKDKERAQELKASFITKPNSFEALVKEVSAQLSANVKR
jgi:CheY-like chemotaxis protein